MDLLRYEDPKTLIHTYGMEDNPFFKDKDPKYIFVVENRNLDQIKHDIEHLGMQFDRVVM